MDLARRSELYERVERATEWPMLLLAIAFVGVVLLPDVMDLSVDAADACDSAGWILWAIFVFETAAKTYLAPDRRRYLRTHWLELVTILVPFLRPVRVVVVSLRLWEEARSAIRHRTLSFIGLASVLVVGLSALLVSEVERGGDGPIQSPADGLWWAMATITTVGYGDMYPRTPQGRAIAVFLMLSGISLFSLLTARIAAFFVESDQSDARLDELLAHVRQLEQQTTQLQAVLTAGSFPASVANAAEPRPTEPDRQPEQTSP